MADIDYTSLYPLPEGALLSQPFDHRLCLAALNFAWDMYDSSHDWPKVCDQISEEFYLNFRESGWLRAYGQNLEEVGRG